MIDVLVVDDDFRVAQVHAGFVAALRGFSVAGLAHTAARARSMAAELAPALVLLDVYLPDASGLTLLPELDADVIMATAAADPGVVREALRGGALHYLVKPFTAAALNARLTAYARYREALSGDGEVTQEALDGAVRALYAPLHGQPPAPKGQSPVTTRLICDALRRADEPRSAAEIADQVGISRATAQRYLAALAQAGRVVVTLRYGATGRPEHQYAWSPR
ncbi:MULTISPECIES: response regulator [Actinomadura]|uniref:Transcriptional regulatory protein n=1 Tax=Actinomadura madurae TaxID=1993 RepID=A0A1I5HE95_9ACTN|nr:response regulator [Actinomadura madurae]MCP9947163.1 response regulator [Actinomadura madurae]MCP9976405.1 response regulator [Actinomadura madurae]MCQ0012104.1 response regulator [Actinomadura madurae]MCQ0012598.1 response regulator [Actinomadura madurae]URN03741.1 response regulator [Actinomadura madurae]